MRFRDPDGRINPNGDLPTFLDLMRQGTVIPPDLYRRVVVDRCITPENAADFIRDGFTPEATLHLSQGWNFVCPMNLRMTAQQARRAGKMLFIVPASIEWCPSKKDVAKKQGGDQRGATVNSVAPPQDVLCAALFRDNSNAAGERMGLLPLYEGASVELLTKMSHTSNILKGARGIVERIIPDTQEEMGWTAPDSEEARRGWVKLGRFPRVVLRLNPEYEAQGAIDGDPSLIVVAPSVATDRGRTKTFNARWQVSGTSGKVGGEVSTLRSCQLPLRPHPAATLASAQGHVPKSVMKQIKYCISLGQFNRLQWLNQSNRLKRSK